MIRKCELLYEQLLQMIDNCQKEHNTTQQCIECGFLAVQKAISDLTDLVIISDFSDEDEEITFFKLLLPKFKGWEEYHALVYSGELVSASSPNPSAFWMEELQMTDNYFRKYQSMYNYYREGRSELDKTYFLRKNNLSLDKPTDDELSTMHSTLIGKFLAREKYMEYIGKKLSSPQL